MNNYNNLGYGYQQQQQPTSSMNYTSSSWSNNNNNDPYYQNNMNSQFGYNQPVVNNSNVMTSNIYPTLSDYKPNIMNSNNYNNNNGGYINNLNQYNNANQNNVNQFNNNQFINQNKITNILPSSSQNNVNNVNNTNNDWDLDLKNKNFIREQSDTSWVHSQQQSWLQPQLSNKIQLQSSKKFSFPNPFIKYKIIPGVDQKKSLDVTSKDQPQKNLIKGHLIIWDYHGGPNQQFYIHRCTQNNKGIENDQFLFINASTGFCVSAMSLDQAKKYEGFTSVYPNVQNDIAQRWRLRPVTGTVGVFMIESVAQRNKVLDCKNQGRDNGTNVIMWDSNKGRNQLWKILPA